MGKTLTELRQATTADEYPLWLAYYQTEGFPTTRIEDAVATGAAYSCQVWGAKVKPEDVKPDYRPAVVHSGATADAILTAWAKTMNGKKKRGR